MCATRPRQDPLGFDAALRGAARGKRIAHEFVLDALAGLAPRTRPMFGCVAVYVAEKIVLVLRDKAGSDADNGVWLATTARHHDSLRRDFPCMRSIGVFGTPVTSWQVLPVDAPDFEEAALRACECIRQGDPRIGTVPKPRAPRRHRTKTAKT